MKNPFKENLNRPFVFNMICSLSIFIIIYPAVSLILWDLFWIDDFVIRCLKNHQNRAIVLFLFCASQLAMYVYRKTWIEDLILKNK